MAARRMMLPDYGTVSMKGTQYYRTRVTDQQGRRVSLYARTREELYQKEQEAIQQIENKTYRRSTPTVEEYCEKWLLMQSAQIRMTTLIDYTSKVKNYIIKPLGDMHMGDVTADDIRLALLAASKKSASVYKSVNVMLLHRGIKSKSEKTWGRDGQKSLPFLHTFDILEGSGVRHDNKSSNTQCMKIDEEENTWLKEKSALLNFRNTEQ